MASDHPPRTDRIQSLDILRGAVVALMAIDHVRVYSGLPPGGPEAGIFFTRWITHFCAPAFVFFAGTSAFLYGSKLRDTKRLARFLATRGLFLVALELTVIRFGWTFNFSYSSFTLAGVIWMLGWCMFLLALVVSWRPAAVGITGLVIIFFQQILLFVPRAFPESMTTLRSLWEFVYPGGAEPLGGITVLYVLVPWIGVMAAGYGFGIILTIEPERRNRVCFWIGLASALLFLLGGIILAVLIPANESFPFVFRVLMPSKYPASQLFLLMTLGPTLMLIPLAGKSRGWLAEKLSVFGRVPFFYYLLHIPLIHISALLVNFLQTGSMHDEWYATAPYVFLGEELLWSLPMLYLVFAVDVVILFFLCRWYGKYKIAHPEYKLLKFI